MSNNSKPKTQNSELKVIKASEIGEYAYCSRAWWYRHVLKLSPPHGEGTSRLAAGTQAHSQHGQTVATSTTLRTIAIALAATGFIALVIAVLLAR